MTQAPAAVVERLVRLLIGILFAVSGNGTLRGARAIVATPDESTTSVIGVPKTFDNGISFVRVLTSTVLPRDMS